MDIKLGQLVSDGVTWAMAQDDSFGGRVLVKYNEHTEIWLLSDIEEIEDRIIIKVLKGELA